MIRDEISATVANPCEDKKGTPWQLLLTGISAKFWENRFVQLSKFF
jgi:hypothetical protein